MMPMAATCGRVKAIRRNDSASAPQHRGEDAELRRRPQRQGARVGSSGPEVGHRAPRP